METQVDKFITKYFNKFIIKGIDLMFDCLSSFHIILSHLYQGRITSELTSLGAACRGERHGQIISRQREALAELRTKVKGLEQSRPPCECS